MHHIGVHAGLALALLLLAGAQDVPMWSERAVPSTSRRAALLEDRRIDESSGLCLSARDSSIFWTMNDSGGEPCVFAIDRSGRTRAKVRVREAVNFDWEDLALGKDDKGQPALFVGDIGDNFHIRQTIQVYQFSEPAVAAAGMPVVETFSDDPCLWRAHYPDGRHNAESLLVHPRTNRLYVLTKSDTGRSAIYAFPERLERDVSMMLIKVADLAFPPLVRAGKRPIDNCMATAADFSPDGSRMAVATYSSLYEWTLPAGQTLEEALLQPPLRIEPELVRQLEGACYDRDGQTLWLTSEHLPAMLMEVRR